MKTLVRLFALVILLFPRSLLGAEPSEVSDTALVHMLNSVEILAERRELPYAIRILRLREHGECDGTPQSCPQATLYIAVSTFDEAPDQKVYMLAKAYGWDFIRWKVFPRKEGPDSFLIFEVKREIIAKDLAKGWWSAVKYEVRVNPWKGDLRELQ